MSVVNQSRRGIVESMDDALGKAELIGFNDEGEACVWSGGVGFNVYDAAREWQELRHFNSGDMADLRDRTTEEARSVAKERMESAGFVVIS